MRKLLLMTLGLFTVVPCARAQSPYPAELTVTAPEVEVRSGPTLAYYPTNTLRYNDRVVVLRESEQEKGWLAIKPPQGSFSWINQKYIKQTDPRTGIVILDGAMLRPGSSVSNKAPDVESCKVPVGSIVTIIGPSKTASDGVIWLPINPWPTEVRYIDAVQARLANNNNSNSANINGILASRTQSPWTPAQAPGNPAQMAQGNPWPAQTASYSPGQNSAAPQKIFYPPQWTQWGTLRRAVADKDGQPTYMLEDARGKLILYVTCQPGFTLRDFVGRNVTLYGSISYRSDDYARTHVMTATTLAHY